MPYNPIEEQEQLIGEALKTPQTLDDLEKKFRVSRSTIWKRIKSLEEQGKVREAPWRVGPNGKMKAWVLVSSSLTGSDPVAKIILETGPVPVYRLAYLAIVGERDQYGPFRGAGGAVAQAWRYVHYVNAPYPESAKAGSTPPIQCKAEVREALEHARKFQRMLEQLLLAPIWEEPTLDRANEPTLAERWGPVDTATENQLIDIAIEWERKKGR